MIIRLVIVFILCTLTACGLSKKPEESKGHITKDSIINTGEIPHTVNQTIMLPEPEIRPNLETYTVVVSDVPAKELLFSMARDANLNLDINSDIKGNVTINAIDQTLPQILQRISKQLNIRYSIEEGNLSVRADTPYLRTYKIDYVNMARETKGVVRVASSLGSAGAVTDGGSAAGGAADNSSSTEVINGSANNFWLTLADNIKDFIDETDNTDTESATPQSSGQSRNKNVIVNKETGLIAVRATGKQHKNVSRYIDNVWKMPSDRY